MIFPEYKNSIVTAASGIRWLRRIMSASLLTVTLTLSLILLTGQQPAFATLTDDRFDGTIFALYAGNGSLVPPKVKLTDSFKRKKPALLVFYTDDSSDSKQYAIVVSQLQEFYGREADFIPVSIDSLPSQPSELLTEPGHYYEGFVPQTVILDQSGKVVFNEKGQIPFEKVDDAFRKVFDLLPREKSIPLKRRVVNELNIELSK
ncbi:MAG: thylakoid membrane photosystem I accumulation factor [Microcoleus sp. PH2017_10_PVI_O_A]|uniref:thylakoid membrane photosystem I accumulation factor n=1 Tax=unclassified Microcoleus TaxID=2642155 RepID=UPI001D22C10C|nr:MULTISPECIES: thylakoid membrane photosystem I accumulation factor [unclassified Microcoleus]TAE86478.1 MAG: thioredoxin family protein [Oscillatoriales cyanobacterium]MCC3410018.1 thylakoid membrane photosystem I accumulation factor [Microcoleus sp. PH2017_10_PVI_O_A]MCC3464280.1 thylakoid membrane photosystem I accumulation factor [Microcoleus sp. PH2017_11_PCY_U_A]MCC3482631.1 thylakoid membrane photosystem I accumulation factor [Microcoleus sp. PH2017_12_PCY_D_A]MCC3531536.1 thylakoid m